MAKLPEEFEEKNQLKNLKVGEIGYIAPWGMWVDNDGNCWLNEEYLFYPAPGGTVQLKIKRVKDGYIAFIHECKGEKWEKQRGPSYASPTAVCYGKVVGFNENFLQKIFSKLRISKN